MDVMMKMTTEDVRVLREQFNGKMSLEQFVVLLKKTLHDRIHSELDFVVGVVELFHTIDVNGDEFLDWDEFAGYMMDAGQAKADFYFDDLAQHTKSYQHLPLPLRDGKTPMNNVRSHIQQMLHLREQNALAYFEFDSDVVFVYDLHFDRDDALRHLSTMRLHTAFQEHTVICMEYVAAKKMLIVSSMLQTGYLSLWSVADLHSPTMVHRVESHSPHEHLKWVSGLQCLLTSAVVFPTISKKKSKIPQGSRDGYRPNASAQVATKLNQLLRWDLAGTGEALVPTELVLRDRFKGVSSLVTFKCINRTHIAIGCDDGVIIVVDAESWKTVSSFDAHGNGVKLLRFSCQFECLASVGFHSYSDETTLHISIWKKRGAAGLLAFETSLKHHDAPVELATFVDSKRQLISLDSSGTFKVYSSVLLTPVPALHLHYRHRHGHNHRHRHHRNRKHPQSEPEFDDTSIPTNYGSQPEKFEIVKSVGNQELNKVAVLVSGSRGESFIQVWSFDVSHTQGTCIAPQLNEEITCVSFFGSSADILGGTASGRVLLWRVSKDDSGYQYVQHQIAIVPELEFGSPWKLASLGRVLSSCLGSCCMELQWLADNVEPSSESRLPSVQHVFAVFAAQLPDSKPSTSSPGSTSNPASTGRDEEEGSEEASDTFPLTNLPADQHTDQLPQPQHQPQQPQVLFPKDHSLDERIERESDEGMYVFAGDDQGFITAWFVRRPSTQSSSPSQNQTAHGATTIVEPLSTATPASTGAGMVFQHGEMVLGYDAIAGLYKRAFDQDRAKRATSPARPIAENGDIVSSRRLQQLQSSHTIQIQPSARWKAHFSIRTSDVGRAIRKFILAQAATPQEKPVKASPGAAALSHSSSAPLTRATTRGERATRCTSARGLATPGNSARRGDLSEMSSRKKYPRVTLADVKPLIPPRPRTSSNVVHCDLPHSRDSTPTQNQKVPALDFTKATNSGSGLLNIPKRKKEICITSTNFTSSPSSNALQVSHSDDTCLTLHDLRDDAAAQAASASVPNQDVAAGKSAAESKPKRSAASSKNDDPVLKCHVKLAHAWKQYQAG